MTSTVRIKYGRCLIISKEGSITIDPDWGFEGFEITVNDIRKEVDLEPLKKPTPGGERSGT